jgi:RHS repeat-associated protein
MSAPRDTRAQTTSSAPQTEPFLGFTGEIQPSSGVVYLRARAYAPQLGRLLQRDSVGGDLSRPPSLNRYIYVENKPVRYTDPSGHAITPETALDLVSITLSARQAWHSWRYQCDDRWVNTGWFAVDLLAGALPFVPAVGIARHGSALPVSGGNKLPDVPEPLSDALQALPQPVAPPALQMKPFDPLQDGDALQDFVRRANAQHAGMGSIASEFPALATMMPEHLYVLHGDKGLRAVALAQPGAFNDLPALRVHLLEGLGNGSGTHMLQSLYDVSPGRLVLNATDSSIGFYQKLTPSLVQDYTFIWQSRPHR